MPPPPSAYQVSLNMLGGERPVFWRESRHFSMVAYLIGKNLAQLPFTFAYPFFFLSFFYQLLRPYAPFQSFYLVLVLVQFAGEGVGQLISLLLTSSRQLAGGIAALLFTVLTGSFPLLQDMGQAFQILSYISPCRWGMSALLSLEFAPWYTGDATPPRLAPSPPPAPHPHPPHLSASDHTRKDESHSQRTLSDETHSHLQTASADLADLTPLASWPIDARRAPPPSAPPPPSSPPPSPPPPPSSPPLDQVDLTQPRGCCRLPPDLIIDIMCQGAAADEGECKDAAKWHVPDPNATLPTHCDMSLYLDSTSGKPYLPASRCHAYNLTKHQYGYSPWLPAQCLFRGWGFYQECLELPDLYPITSVHPDDLKACPDASVKPNMTKVPLATRA